MKENYFICIDGTMQQSNGEDDTVTLMTRGTFSQLGDRFFIMYKDSEATGYEGSTTTLKVESNSRVSMSRSGSSIRSQLVIECGKRHVCHYENGYGSLSLGVAADEIKNNLNENGGELTFSYTLDSGNTQISHNKVKITIKERS